MNIELLKQTKKEKKMTFPQISEISGVPLSTLYDIFRGITTAPRIDTIQAIERALGLNQQPEWTDEEKALGVGRHSTYLSEDDYEWLELKSEILRIHGENYLNTLKTMLIALTKE